MAVWRLRSVWLLVLASFIGCCPETAADRETSGSEAPSPRPTAAYLNTDASPLGALLEQRLLANARAVWLERNAVEAVQREQQLQSLLSAAAVGERVVGLSLPA